MAPPQTPVSWILTWLPWRCDAAAANVLRRRWIGWRRAVDAAGCAGDAVCPIGRCVDRVSGQRVGAVRRRLHSAAPHACGADLDDVLCSGASEVLVLLSADS